MKTLPSSLVLALVVSSFASAARAEESPGAKITHDEHVVPIFREKCFACHNADKQRGGLDLSSFSKLMEGGSSGAVIEPGDPDSSRLFLLVSHKQEPYMPPKSDKLPDGTLEVLRQWIAGGALENAGSTAKAAGKPRLDLAVPGSPTSKPEGPPPLPSGLSLDPVVRGIRPGIVSALAVSPWAPLAALSGQEAVLLYHTDTFELVGVLPFPEGAPCVLKFSRGGRLLLAGGGRGGKSGRAVVWNVITGERVAEAGDELDSVLAADLSADHSMVALGGPGKVVRVYSTQDGKLLYEIKKHTDWIRALEFSPDGVLLATGDRSGGLVVWEAPTGREFLSLAGHEASITDLSWRADSNVLATSSEDSTIRLWEVENGTQVKRWTAHGGGVSAVEFCRDGRLVSAGRDKTVKEWDSSGAAKRQYEAFGDIALAAAFDPEGSRAIGGDWTGEVRVWATADGKLLGKLDLNPPSLAERIDAASKDLAARTESLDRARKAVDESKAALSKAGLDLEAAQKAASEAQALLEKLQSMKARVATPR